MKLRSTAGRVGRSALVAPLAAAALVLAMSAVTAAQTPAPGTSATPTVKPSHAVDLTAKLRIKPVGAAFVGTGPTTGTPFGSGRAKLRSTITSRSPLRTSTTLTIVTTKGNAVFKGPGRYVGNTFTLTMKAFSGAGRYRGITGTNLAVRSVNRGGVDRLRMKGTVRYGAAPQTTTP